MTSNQSRILIADDEPPNRELLRALLAPHGYELLFAVNGAEAVEKATTSRPDLILLDVMMPELNGWEACVKIRSYPELAEIPIVMITALDDRASRLRGLEAGADDFLTKPFDREELTVRVRGITRLNRYRLLVQEREKFEQIIYLAPDAILIVDWQAKVRLANRAAQLLLTGQESKTPPSQTLLQLLAPGEATRLSEPLGELFAGGSERLLLQTRFLDLKGRALPVSISARYFPWDAQPAVQLNIRELSTAGAVSESAKTVRSLTTSLAQEIYGLLKPGETDGGPNLQPSWRSSLQQAQGLCSRLLSLAASPESAASQIGQNERILLAVASASWRRVAEVVLGEAGFSVSCLDSASQAWTALKQGESPTDVVIMDQTWAGELDTIGEEPPTDLLKHSSWIVLTDESHPLLPTWLSNLEPRLLSLSSTGPQLTAALEQSCQARKPQAKAA